MRWPIRPASAIMAARRSEPDEDPGAALVARAGAGAGRTAGPGRRRRARSRSPASPAPRRSGMTYREYTLEIMERGRYL